MESKNYLIFSYYYINQDQEVDKIIKDKVSLSSNILPKEELFKHILKFKKLYHSPVQLHEILLFTSDDEENIDVGNFKKLNYAFDIELSPKQNIIEHLTRLYVFFKAKSPPKTKSLKHKLSNRMTRKISQY